MAAKSKPRHARSSHVECDDSSRFGRVAVLDVTPAQGNDIYLARIELGETFQVSAQVFL